MLDIAAEHDLIERGTCPICHRCTGGVKNTRRALQAHINRVNDPEHRLWKDLYWKIHYVRGGYHHQPRPRTLEEVVAIVHKYFGEGMSRGVRAHLEATGAYKHNTVK